VIESFFHYTTRADEISFFFAPPTRLTAE